MAVTFMEGELLGSQIMRVELECKRVIEFNVQHISPDNRQWVGERIEAQVNHIVSLERQAAVEEHKNAVYDLIKPTTKRLL
jgi:hypothetical protein